MASFLMKAVPTLHLKSRFVLDQSLGRSSGQDPVKKYLTECLNCIKRQIAILHAMALSNIKPVDCLISALISGNRQMKGEWGNHQQSRHAYLKKCHLSIIKNEKKTDQVSTTNFHQQKSVGCLFFQMSGRCFREDTKSFKHPGANQNCVNSSCVETAYQARIEFKSL